MEGIMPQLVTDEGRDRRKREFVTLQGSQPVNFLTGQPVEIPRSSWPDLKARKG